MRALSAAHWFAARGVIACVAAQHRFLRILHPRRNHNLLRYFLIDRSDVVPPAAIVKFPHDGRVSPSDQAQDTAFGAAVRTNVADLDDHAIAVHGRSHGRRRNEDVSHQSCLQARLERIGFRNYKTEAVAMHGQPSHRHVLAGGGLRNGIAVRPHLLKLAARHQVLKALEEFAAGISMDTEFARHLLEAGRAFGLLLDLLQDGGIGKHSDGCHS